MKYPGFQVERKLWKKGYKRVVCLDEVGRGPLAGPVVAAAVMIDKLKIKNLKLKIPLGKIKDSKKLTKRRREEFYKLLTSHPAVKWGRGRVSERVIDKINILQATKLVMKKVIENLKKKLSHISYDRRKCGIVDFLILDGKIELDLPIPQKSIVKADEKVFSCAVASIIAKVYRDRIMEKYHKKYPRYGFDKHKGYPTKYHKKMLKKYGPCKIHRQSFNPVREYKKLKGKTQNDN